MGSHTTLRESLSLFALAFVRSHLYLVFFQCVNHELQNTYSIMTYYYKTLYAVKMIKLLLKKSL